MSGSFRDFVEKNLLTLSFQQVRDLLWFFLVFLLSLWLLVATFKTVCEEQHSPQEHIQHTKLCVDNWYARVTEISCENVREHSSTSSCIQKQQKQYEAALRSCQGIDFCKTRRPSLLLALLPSTPGAIVAAVSSTFNIWTTVCDGLSAILGRCLGVIEAPFALVEQLLRAPLMLFGNKVRPDL